MQHKKLYLFALLHLSLWSATANANVILHSEAGNVCEQISGPWTGTGTVSANLRGIKIKCDYSGNAIATSSDPGVFSIDVTLTLISGLCPSSAHIVSPGTCDSETGTISLQSDEADLTGTLSSDGRSANLTGTVQVPVKGRTLTATVEKMNLNKV